MKHILFIFLFLMLGTTSFAEQARVIKVKGQQAIVQFPPGTRPQVGQFLDIGDGLSIDDDGSGGKKSVGDRTYLLGVSTELSVKSSDSSSGSTTRFALSGRFGWNLVDMEVGPLGTLIFNSASGGSSTTYGIGGFFDYNLVPNRPGVELVYGAGAEASYSGNSVANSSISSSSLGFFIGGFLKYFALGNSVALRGDAGFDYLRISQSNTSSVRVTSGFVVKGGLSVYF